MDFIGKWSERTDLPARQFIAWLGITDRKYFKWKQRYGKALEHNAKIPRDHWLTEEEKQAIVDFYLQYPDEGYRRLTFMMMDRNIVAVSPATVYRVLSMKGLLGKKKSGAGRKNTGFEQPVKPHEHWHVDISYRYGGPLTSQVRSTTSAQCSTAATAPAFGNGRALGTPRVHDRGGGRTGHGAGAGGLSGRETQGDLRQRSAVYLPGF